MGKEGKWVVKRGVGQVGGGLDRAGNVCEIKMGKGLL